MKSFKIVKERCNDMMQEHINYYKHFLLFVVIWIPNQTQTPVRQKIGVNVDLPYKLP